MADSFFVNVQSDASAEYYTSNTRVNFRNHLATPINVDALRYEVALTELSYTYNAPYIRKGTDLFTLYRVPETFKAAEKVIHTNDSTSKEYDIDVLEYAKENGYHLDSANAFMDALNLPRDKGKKRLSIGKAKIYARGYINNTKELIAELQAQLSPLDIVFLHEEGEGINKLTITHRTPDIIAQKFPDYNPEIYDHFELAGSSDGYDSGYYYVKTDIADTPIQFKRGDWLLTLLFVKGEYERTEGGQERKLTTISAREDIRTMQELSEALNRASEFVKVNVIGNIAHLKVKTPETTKLVFDDRVLAILGISTDTIIPAGTEINRQGTETTVFDIGCRKIYVYTDIIENQRVGDQMAPLLRITDYTGTQDQTEIKDFNHLQYMRLRNDNIESIRIYLKTETGDDLPLTFGIVTCTLHFREKRF